MGRSRAVKPTRDQKALISAAGLEVRSWLVLAKTPEELRLVVILRFFTGYTQAETAAALEIPQGTVATRQRRALALLRLELGEEEQP